MSWDYADVAGVELDQLNLAWGSAWEGDYLGA